MKARIIIAYTNAAITGAFWLLVFSSKANLPFPAEWVTLPLAVSVFIVTVVLLPGKPRTERQ